LGVRWKSPAGLLLDSACAVSSEVRTVIITNIADANETKNLTR
jgi:hypothetical protein